MLFNIHDGQLGRGTTEIFGVPRALLPEVRAFERDLW